jgi:hypothetical protein
MSQNVGNFVGESVNPELRATTGPVYAMLSITGSLILALAFFVGGKRFIVSRPSESSSSLQNEIINTEGAPQQIWYRRLWDWRLTSDAKAVWRITKIYLLLVGSYFIW